MRHRPSKYERELKSEERRAVIWLGILAIVVAFRFWLKDDPANPPYINFFCDSPCAHFTLYWIPFLEILIYFWIGYALCMLVYFSEDLFLRFGRQGTEFRLLFRFLGNLSILVYPAFVGFIIVTFVTSLFLPDWLQSPYWFLVTYGLAWGAFWVFERLSGQRQTRRRLGEASLRGAYLVAELLIEVILPILEALARRILRGRTPPRLRRLWLKGRSLLRKRREPSWISIQPHVDEKWSRMSKTLRNVKWKYLGYAFANVVVVGLSGLLIGNPSEGLLVSSILFLLGLSIAYWMARWHKAWIKHYTMFLTWFGVTYGAVAIGQLSRTTLSLASFVQSDWRVLIGAGLFVVIIALTFYFVDILRGGAFVVDTSKS